MDHDYDLASFVINSHIKNHIGSKNTIILALFLETLTTFGLGLISYSNQPKVFLGINLVLRFFQGTGEVLL